MDTKQDSHWYHREPWFHQKVPYSQSQDISGGDGLTQLPAAATAAISLRMFNAGGAEWFCFIRLHHAWVNLILSADGWLWCIDFPSPRMILLETSQLCRCDMGFALESPLSTGWFIRIPRARYASVALECARLKPPAELKGLITVGSLDGSSLLTLALRMVAEPDTRQDCQMIQDQMINLVGNLYHLMSLEKIIIRWYKLPGKMIPFHGLVLGKSVTKLTWTAPGTGKHRKVPSDPSCQTREAVRGRPSLFHNRAALAIKINLHELTWVALV